MPVEDHRHVDRLDDGGDALGHVGREVVTGGVHDAHGLRAERGQQRALFGQLAGAGHVAHEQDALGFGPEVPRDAEVVFGYIGLGAVRGDPHHIRAVRHGGAQVVGGAQPGAMKTPILEWVRASRTTFSIDASDSFARPI